MRSSCASVCEMVVFLHEGTQHNIDPQIRTLILGNLQIGMYRLSHELRIQLQISNKQETDAARHLYYRTVLDVTACALSQALVLCKQA